VEEVFGMDLVEYKDCRKEFMVEGEWKEEILPSFFLAKEPFAQGKTQSLSFKFWEANQGDFVFVFFFFFFF
jgi:hypothetical protein